MNAYSNDLANILNGKAIAQSRKYYHTSCGTPHLFLAMFGFLAMNKDTEEYGETYKKLREVLNKYGVTGQVFEASFLQFYPKGDPEELGAQYNIKPDEEYRIVVQNLNRNAVKCRRSMEVQDLIFELFSDRSYNIYTIFEDIIKDSGKVQEMYGEIQKAFMAAPILEISELEELDEVTNVNKYVAKNPITTINAEETIKKIEMCLSGRSIKNCVLTGPAGTGKTTYVYELAQRINRGDVPESFRGKVIYELNSANMVAGTKYRGEFEQKLKNIVMIFKEHPEAILFVDEMHTLLGLGGAEGAAGAGDLLKPYITRGELQIIGATTDEEYTKNLLPDKAFISRFHEIKINEPTREETKQILIGLLPVETKFFNKEIQMELLDKVIDMSMKYTLEQANPRKAINMLELACAYCKVFEDNKQIVNVDDVIESVRLRYNIYISKDKMADTKRELFKELLGQDDALNQVLRNLEMVERGITDIERPALSMLLCGPTG